jgi:hypothetical protein
MLSVYAVALSSPEDNLGRAAVRDRLEPFLSALVQIDEPGHAGASAVTVANTLLNLASALTGARRLKPPSSPATPLRARDDPRSARVGARRSASHAPRPSRQTDRCPRDSLHEPANTRPLGLKILDGLPLVA